MNKTNLWICLLQMYGKTPYNDWVSPIFFIFAMVLNRRHMRYHNIIFNIDCPENLREDVQDILADAASDIGFDAFESQEEGFTGYIMDSKYDQAALDNVIKQLPFDGVKITYQVSDIEDKNWNETWENQGFEPIVIRDKCLIYDAKKGDIHADRERYAISIGIDTCQAFGTGTHHTTQMMLILLLESIRPGDTVIDCGCGTGILGIAAAKLHADRVIAYDIDPWSARNTQHNAELNGVRSQMDIKEGDVTILTGLNTQADILMANINRNVLLVELSEYLKHLKPAGTLIMSGFLTEDLPLLQEALTINGCHEIATLTSDEWASIRCLK